MELIISPGIIFLDEPTTGLDAGTAVSVVRLLKEYVEMCVVVWGLVLRCTCTDSYCLNSAEST